MKITSQIFFAGLLLFPACSQDEAILRRELEKLGSTVQSQTADYSYQIISQAEKNPYRAGEYNLIMKSTRRYVSEALNALRSDDPEANEVIFERLINCLREGIGHMGSRPESIKILSQKPAEFDYTLTRSSIICIENRLLEVLLVYIDATDRPFFNGPKFIPRDSLEYDVMLGPSLIGNAHLILEENTSGGINPVFYKAKEWSVGTIKFDTLPPGKHLLSGHVVFMNYSHVYDFPFTYRLEITK